MPTYNHPLLFGALLETPSGRPLEVLRLADSAESCGLDVVSLPDHPYWPDRLDTFTLLSAIAQRTARIRLLCNVANLPLRPPAFLARVGATLDWISDGRFDLGIGAGAQQLWDLIVAEGGPRRGAAESVDALEEAVQIIRELWSPSARVSFDGNHYRLDEAEPSPLASGSIGIWVGGYRARMLGIIGRLADGWISSSPMCSPADIAAGNELIDAAAESAGRARDSIRRGYNIEVKFDASDKGFLQGRSNKIAKELAELSLTQGVSMYLLYRVESADTLSRFAEEVVPVVREMVEAG
ncbi:N5,N10-methylene tetrahydromethanopterin reductase [Mycobacterium montefiorense]|uniref:N5,N10-methylene tetrahydromethanopterin reductase n=2 Tax=Mycobacterium montefiorense TaxID=154654 RepID=A0AA37UMA0_9MYCO|nr:LLM class flavin-dependent oxidoreductase [Mycobacterium montefiorense]GBG38291.1 N5,N10-methylene tetrahydromethanopterin reductase [Mycobacterium montefiorense]GKU36183.1 N5,N10-methylene tetrahydromethanopterin reductase [Mycobacterium montefiorense]GKU38738.1 N5,N10-methylene tetrahydromethanopterin reductase [Mycobacterium montefiorense]GKU48254.1 N5,N10-methylene tetrahydromethanopterin reductase [Mycobacterium montefiorense]GKU53927.1 N5,N10-methylene tetrahydromethanopterin reductas